MVAAAIGGSAVAGLVGSKMSSDASKSAAGTQSAAANHAADLQNAQFQQTTGNFAPFLNLGRSSINPLIQALGYQAGQDANGAYQFTRDTSNPLQQTFNAPTAQEAQNTPGYQFTMDQGLRGVQNSAAARGLGTSGAALKGAAGYATGLADSTYNDVYNRALSTFKTNYGTAADNAGRIGGLVTAGQNAAGNLATAGGNAVNSIANTLTNGANAQASGIVGSANALSSGLSNLGNSAFTYGMMQNNAGGGAGAAPYSGVGNPEGSASSGIIF